MRLIMFMVFSQYGLACKYEIIFQISIYNLTQKCILHFFFSLFIFEVGFVLKVEGD